MAVFSGVGTAWSSRFVETGAKCVQEASRNSFRGWSEAWRTRFGARKTSKAEEALKCALGSCTLGKVKHPQ